MRFFPSNPRRTAAEILLTVAIIAFVVYDLSGNSAKPEATNVVLSFESKSTVQPSASAPSRFESTVTGIAAGNTFTVCDNTIAPQNPWVIGNFTANQALIIRLGDNCPPAPTLLAFNSTTNASVTAGIIVQGGSWLSFQNIMYTNGIPAGARTGPLVMLPNSVLEAVFSRMLHVRARCYSRFAIAGQHRM